MTALYTLEKICQESEAFEKRLINETLLKKSLLSLNRLLNEIYTDGIEPLAAPIEELIKAEGTDQ